MEEDRAVLLGPAEQVGVGSNALKEATAWLGEKVSRLQLRRRAARELGTFEALKALALGILGKLALWRALAVVAAANARLRGWILITSLHVPRRSTPEWKSVV